MQLDVEVSPPAFAKAQLEMKCACSVLGVYVLCGLNVGCIEFAVHTQPILHAHSVCRSVSAVYTQWYCKYTPLPSGGRLKDMGIICQANVKGRSQGQRSESRSKVESNA